VIAISVHFSEEGTCMIQPHFTTEFLSTEFQFYKDDHKISDNIKKQWLSERTRRDGWPAWLASGWAQREQR
jgi:hypothetical protein